MTEERNPNVSERKWAYRCKLRALLDEFTTCLMAGVDNVGSKQLADIRRSLRGRAHILMGKNTMIRKILREYIADTGNTKLEKLVELVEGNVGFVFTKEPIGDIREAITSNRRNSAAKAGSIAPCDVTVPAGPTGMEPTMTGFFQSLNIPTKIMRGQIEIVSDVHLIHKGKKVGPSEATLLVKLGVRPFEYGMSVKSVYDDGNAYAAEVLDIEDSDVCASFMVGLAQVAMLSLAINYPTMASVPHSAMRAYKDCLALALSLPAEYEWENLKHVKMVLENPEAFASAGPATGGGGDGGAAAAAEEAPEEESESSEGGGGGLFGDDDSESSS